MQKTNNADVPKSGVIIKKQELKASTYTQGMTHNKPSDKK